MVTARYAGPNKTLVIEDRYSKGYKKYFKYIKKICKLYKNLLILFNN